MRAPPQEDEIPEYYDPSEAPGLMSIEEDADLIEHEILLALLNIVRNGARDSDKRAAASDLGELIGKKGKSVQVIQAKNVQLNQLNQQISQKPEFKRALMDSAHGLRSLVEAEDANIKSKFGGEGV